MSGRSRRQPTHRRKSHSHRSGNTFSIRRTRRGRLGSAVGSIRSLVRTGAGVVGSDPLARFFGGDGAAITAAFLVGLSGGMTIVGLTLACTSLFGATPTSVRSIVAGAMLGLAVGVRIPQRVAMWVCLEAWRRVMSRGSGWDGTGVLLRSDSGDRSLYWVVLSVIALLAGLATALLPVGMRVVEFVYRYALDEFLWSPASLVALHGSLALAVGLIPLAALGLGACCVHHLCCQHGSWDLRASAVVMFGGASGMATGWMIGGAGDRAGLVLIVAALPILIVALASVVSGSPRFARVSSSTGALDRQLPAYSDRWPRLLRAGIVLVGSAGAVAPAVWLSQAVQQTTLLLGIALMLVCGGAGIWIARRERQSDEQSVGGFGVSCVVAGGCIVVAGLVMDGETSNGAGSLAVACASVLTVTFATAYGQEALFHRVASKSLEGAKILARLLLGLALVIWLVTPVGLDVLGSEATLFSTAALLLLVGGALIMHEPSYSRRSRRKRLAAVCCTFGALALGLFTSSGPHEEHSGSRRNGKVPQSPGRLSDKHAASKIVGNVID